ncbi:hypothetical protein [Pseudomonas sp. R37(2017)]|nr:hypothetical protein [Pseudomonas sp. R37(2017)]
MMASSERAIARVTKWPLAHYKQLAELSLLFFGLLIMLVLSAAVAMEWTL